MDQSAQAHAARMHSALSQLLTAEQGMAACDHTAGTELQAVFAKNEQLARTLASNKHNSTADDTEDLQEACSRRTALLDNILQQLDDSVCSLRSQLDDCHKVLRIAPCTSDPETIMRYAHRLRYGFLPLGISDFIVPVPPAPQDFHFIPSLLKKHHESKAQQQGVAPPAAPQQPLPQAPQQQPQQQQQLEQQEQAIASVQQQQQQLQQAQQQPAQMDQAHIGRLNSDLSDETADEELSDSDDDEDDI